MGTLAKLVVKLITDVSEFEAGMQAASKKMAKIGDEMQKVGGNLDKFVTLPLVAVGAASLKFAADLDDAMSNSEKVFGESSKTIETWAQSAAKNLGMSKSAATQAAVGYGQFLTAMGNTPAKAAEMSTALIGLSTDLAELNGEDATKVMDALQSGLAGKAQGLKQYGIVLDEATLKSSALSMGIWNESQAFTDAIKSQAAYASIMQQTSDIQGYYAGQTGDMGKSLAEIKAKLEDLFATFGQKILPIAVQLLDALIPILDFFANLPPGVQSALVYFAMFAASVGPILGIVGNLISLFGTFQGLFVAGGALASVGTFFAGLVPALTGATAAVGGIAAALGAVLAPALAIGIAIAALIVALKLMGPAALESLKMLGVIIASLVKGIVQQLASIGPAILNAIRNAIQGVVNFAVDFWNAGVAMISGFVNGIMAMATRVVETVSQVIRWTIDAVKKLLGIKSPSKIFEEVGRNTMLGMAAGIEDFANVPVQATVQATAATIPAASGIAAGGARGINVGPITITGDLSPAQMESLEQRIHRIFGEDLLNVMEGA